MKIGKQRKLSSVWKPGEAQTVTFIVTEDCNLRCKYCYITHKAANKRMNLETAKQFIDYILSDDFKRSPAIILEFVGGEPLIEVELIDQICDYFKVRAYECRDKTDWYWQYRISICTNGVNYSSDVVQQFIKKNARKMSLAITLDGTKEKHDLQRVFPDGSGSYDTIIKSIPLYLSQFPGNTKVTFASDDLPLLKDSIASLWQLGITSVSANVVYEDVWKDGDDAIFEEQLIQLADYIVDNDLYENYFCSLFDDFIGFPYSAFELNTVYCGAGKMLALSPDGNMYPCIRYKDFSLNHHSAWSIGTVETGINSERLRPFMALQTKFQSDAKCISCEIASGCGVCQGFSYDESADGTNFHRATYMCKMQKARVRANNYYFAKLHNKYGYTRLASDKRKRLYFMLADDYVSYCATANNQTTQDVMSGDTITRGLQYAYQNYMAPVFVHSASRYEFTSRPEYEGHIIQHIIPARFHKESSGLENVIYVHNVNETKINTGKQNCILNIAVEEIPMMSDCVLSLLNTYSRVNVNVQNLDKYFPFEAYSAQLKIIAEKLAEEYKKSGTFREVNTITDLCFSSEANNCKAGDRKLAVMSTGKIYPCHAFASEAQAWGDIEAGVTPPQNERHYKQSNSALCGACDALQCMDCVYSNRQITGEISVSSSYQCRKSFAEREATRHFLELSGVQAPTSVPFRNYSDPLQFLSQEYSVNYYKADC